MDCNAKCHFKKVPACAALDAISFLAPFFQNEKEGKTTSPDFATDNNKIE